MNDHERKRRRCDCDLPDCGCDLPCGCDLMITSLLLVGPATRRPAARTRMSGPGRVGVAAIRGYQRWLSPRLPTRCRLAPTCSRYGIEAVRRYGLAYGTRLTAVRVRRCGAGHGHGTPDPVP